MTTFSMTDRVLRNGLIFLCFYIVFVPYQYISWSSDFFHQLVVLGLRILPVALSFLLFCIGLAKQKSSFWSGIPASIPVLVLVGVFFLGTLGALKPLFGLARLGYYTITGVCLYFIAFIAMNKPAQIFAAGKAVLGLIFVVAVLGLLEFVLQHNIFYSQIFDLANPLYSQFTSEPYAYRISSTLGHPVYLACLLVLFFPFFLYAFDCATKIYIRILFLISILSVFGAVFLTFSRGGWVACLVSLLVYYLPRKRRLFQILICFAFVVISLLNIPKINQIVEKRNTYQAYAREMEVGGRMHSYKVVNAMIQEFPLWGVGTAHYRFMSGKYGDYDGTPDNAYLMLLSEGGLVGFAVFAVVMFKILGFFFRHSSYASRPFGDPTDVKYRLIDAYVASFTGFLVESLTCDAFHFPITRMMFWIVAGHGVAAIRVLYIEQAGLAKGMVKG